MSEELNNKITLMAVGDIMLGGGVSELMLKEGWLHPFKHVTSVFKKADIVFGNLPTPLSNHNKRNPMKPIDYPALKAEPDAVKGLIYAGFNVLSLANNHILDFGDTALFDTMDVLTKANIGYVGVGKNESESESSLLIQINGIKLAFLAYSCAYQADKNRPGCAPIRLPLIKKNVIQAKKIADIVIVSLHHGLEYSDYPVPSHISLVHNIIDSGADLILAHHPHVIQGIEHYKKGVIAYSLGNFVHNMSDKKLQKENFDSSALSKLGGIIFDINDIRPIESIIFKCLINKNGISDVEAIPIIINDSCQPTILQGEKGQALLNRLEQISTKIHDDSMPIWRILEHVNAQENVISLFKRDPSYILKKFYRIRGRHIKSFMTYLGEFVHKS